LWPPIFARASATTSPEQSSFQNGGGYSSGILAQSGTDTTHSPVTIAPIPPEVPVSRRSCCALRIHLCTTSARNAVPFHPAVADEADRIPCGCPPKPVQL